MFPSDIAHWADGCSSDELSIQSHHDCRSKDVVSRVGGWKGKGEVIDTVLQE